MASYDQKPVQIKKEEKIKSKLITVQQSLIEIDLLEQLVKDKLVTYEKLRNTYKIKIKNSKNQIKIEQRLKLNKGCTFNENVHK